MTSYKQKALELVDRLYYGKTDLMGEPYIGHLVRVYDKVNAKYQDDELSAIALLHDVLEDFGASSELSNTLFNDFSGRIINGLESITNTGDYESYISSIKFNPDAIKVKLADLEDNMDITRLKTLSEGNIKRLKKYHKAYKDLTARLNEIIKTELA
ncbi:hypothetical protein ACJRPK_13985 [Aquimarina sp. 2-A2]|uniref:hypothetical protein n=1 Tax=Aquimarina sp. 2-A2 TaxID=3382644 RepID=UPI00387F2498